MAYGTVYSSSLELVVRGGDFWILFRPVFRPTTREFSILIFYLFVTSLVARETVKLGVELLPSLLWWDVCTIQGGRVSGCVICCRIHFSRSFRLQQIKFAFRKSKEDRINHAFGRSGLLLEESGEHLFHRASVNPNFLLQMVGAFCSNACGVQGAWVDSTSYRILQPGSNVGGSLPTSLSFIRRTFIMAKDRIELQTAYLQVPLYYLLLDRSPGELNAWRAYYSANETGGRDTKKL